MIETRFQLDREIVLKSLNEGLYDDISAVYYLIHYEKQTRGKIEGEIQAMGSNPLSLTPSPTTIVSDLSGKELNKATTVPSSTRKTAKSPDTNNIPEDEVLDEVSSNGSGNTTGTSAARAVQKPKIKRRVTVGAGDSANMENSAPIVAPVKKAAPQESDMNGHVAQFSSPVPRTVQTAASDNTGYQDPAGRRKRHNTIVGIFRNTIRRPSEVGPGPPSAPISENPTKNNNFDALQEDGEDSGNNISPNEPRSLRFTFNSNSTSSKPPDDIVHEVSNVCIRQGVGIKLLSRYVLECTYVNPSGGENLKFEVEICKLPRLKNLHGLRFKRLGGSSSDYKDVCEKVLDSVQL
jgi:MAP/microtubule affinity-regulating kinase